MILQQLTQDYERILRYSSDVSDTDDPAEDTGGEDTPPSMYDTKPVRWVIVLDKNGAYKGIRSLTGGGKKDRGLPLLVPSLVRPGKTIRPLLLADERAYILGDDVSDHRAADKHQAFKVLVQQCAQETRLTSVQAVSTFLDQWADEQKRPQFDSDIPSGELITFEIDGERPVDHQKVRAFWAQSCDGIQKKSAPMQCLVCSHTKPAVEIMPFLIKGLPNGQTAGTALVSANSVVFESYGLKRATTSPICADCAESSMKALKALLGNQRTRLRVGALVYVFWTATGNCADILESLNSPQPEDVKALLESYKKGTPRTLEDATAFYALALSASAARAVVRDWLTTTVGRVRENLARWFEWQRIPDGYGQEGKPLPVWRLAASLYRKADDIETRVPQLLMRSALHSDTLPVDLLHRAVLRNRAERNVTYERAALMEIVLRSLQTRPLPGITGGEEGDMTQSDQEEMSSKKDEQARLCGRLLAVLEEIQRAQADSKINATLVDRFYGAASSAPGTVFGTLLKNVQPHLAKLRKKSEGAHYRLQRQLEDIQSQLYEMGEFPTTLPMKRQALFSLGYYYQRAEMRAEGIAAGQAKRDRDAKAASALEDSDSNDNDEEKEN